MIDQLKRFVGPIDRRLRAMLMRANVTAVDDSKDLQQIQVSRLEGETIDDCERVGQFGFTSVPPEGAEVIIGQIGGNADHQVVLGVDDKSRPHPIPAGAAVVYDVSGTKITLNADGSITIQAAGAVNIQSASVVVDGILVTNDTIVGHGGALINTLHVTGNVVIDGTLNGHAP